MCGFLWLKKLAFFRLVCTNQLVHHAARRTDCLALNMSVCSYQSFTLFRIQTSSTSTYQPPFGWRSFHVSAATILWNSLPHDRGVRFCECLTTFWNHIKAQFMHDNSGVLNQPLSTSTMHCLIMYPGQWTLYFLFLLWFYSSYMCMYMQCDCHCFLLKATWLDLTWRFFIDWWWAFVCIQSIDFECVLVGTGLLSHWAVQLCSLVR